MQDATTERLGEIHFGGSNPNMSSKGGADLAQTVGERMELDRDAEDQPGLHSRQFQGAIGSLGIIRRVLVLSLGNCLSSRGSTSRYEKYDIVTDNGSHIGIDENLLRNREEKAYDAVRGLHKPS